MSELQATSKGESIYKESDCSMCHGELGDGEGFLAAGLLPKPRDFTDFMQMNTVPDMAIVNAIRDGLPGTSMPILMMSRLKNLFSICDHCWEKPISL